jgi:hypothetical protein
MASYSSLLAFWVGGSGVPTTPTPVGSPAGGWFSHIGYWVGGLAAPISSIQVVTIGPFYCPVEADSWQGGADFVQTY